MCLKYCFFLVFHYLNLNFAAHWNFIWCIACGKGPLLHHSWGCGRALAWLQPNFVSCFIARHTLEQIYNHRLKLILKKKYQCHLNNPLISSHINGFVQERCNSIANTLEFCLSCTKPPYILYRTLINTAEVLAYLIPYKYRGKPWC